MDEAVTPWEAPGWLCDSFFGPPCLSHIAPEWLLDRCLSYPLDTGTNICFPTKPHEETEQDAGWMIDSPWLSQAVLVLRSDKPFNTVFYQSCLTVLQNSSQILHLHTALLHLTDWMLAGCHPPKEAVQGSFRNILLSKAGYFQLDWLTKLNGNDFLSGHLSTTFLTWHYQFQQYWTTC